MTLSKFLTIAALLLLLPIANISARTRTKCCHGCGSYYCNHTNCGDKCKMGRIAEGVGKGVSDRANNTGRSSPKIRRCRFLHALYLSDLSL